MPTRWVQQPPLVESFRERLPAAGLAGHVTCVWVQEVARESAPYRQRTVPNGGVELACALGSPLRVVGPQRGPAEHWVAPGSVVVGVRLRPGVAPLVLGVPASALVDLEVGADELWGPMARLNDALAGATSPADAVALLEKEVAWRLAGAPAADAVAARAVWRLTRGRTIGLAGIARELQVSERQLRRRVEAATGLAPKPLQRVLRFQRFLALAAADGQPKTQLARLAAEAGYADQSHLTREAVRLEGRTPRALLLETETHCRCAHDHSASYGQLLEDP